ncbi:MULTISPECIES: diacylglycerol kinase family protein [unclassified Microbacterium]|uniref:diacylglycerol/lipid kinase family protein n=1 Tax=unclassified Microbacterium TaxID=2609290 RepID=UPI00214CDB71|nr:MULTISPECIES: diacylglycerol kinase family protein [unclassified Microbacterium]MCR2811001.1 NAD(+)/NADH kinase [Microbacterium sp. zg.B185]WIM19601.1 diacylglycerol kinase family protein [Microbacterium sp. zg-B185]
MSPKTAVIWNPTKTERETLEAGLAQTGHEAATGEIGWWETTEEDPGQGAAGEALAAGAELVIVAGGDGTVRAVAQHLAEVSADVDLAIVPLGTGNLLARNFSVPINDVTAALAQAFSGDPRPLDVGWVDIDLVGGSERHAFVVMVGFGIDAHMLAETNDDLKDKAGWLAYAESLGRALAASEIVPFHITTDEQPGRDEDGHTLLIANCGMIQGGLTLLPDADPADGELNYLVLSAEGFAQWAGTLKTMIWDNALKRLISQDDELTNTDTVHHGRARKIVVTLPEPRAFEIDGEEIGETRSFTVSLQPAAIRLR